MKILHLSYSDYDGGASIAAYRLHRKLLEIGVDSKMMVVKKMRDDSSVLAPLSSFGISYQIFLSRFSHLLLRMQHSGNPIFHSLNLFPGLIASAVMKYNPDLIHLHWICNEMLSIRQIACLPFPIVWTFHDAWPICGAEHHSFGLNDSRFQNGYSRKNNLNHGVDWDRFVWQKKMQYWFNKSFNIVTPSHWLENRVRQSPLFRNSKIQTIPNGVVLPSDPVSKQTARKHLHLPENKILLGFGAFFLRDENKGGKELLKVMQAVYEKNPKIEWVVMGNAELPQGPWIVHVLGKLDAESECRYFYSAIDLLVMTSKIENLPNMLIESLGCGTPCVAFRVGGIPEIVHSKVNGYLAEPFSISDLVNGIFNCLATLPLEIKLDDVFLLDSVAMQYFHLYKKF